jgi:hypothetical protein
MVAFGETVFVPLWRVAFFTLISQLICVPKSPPIHLFLYLHFPLFCGPLILQSIMNGAVNV